jgi:hypothetical protein
MKMLRLDEIQDMVRNGQIDEEDQPMYVLGAVLIILLVAALLSFLLMYAWNIGMVTAFGLPQITYVQALCLFFVSRTLLGRRK